MFISVSKEKTRYQKGQVFPFLIALLAVMLIFIMITVNLGQIGVFKTDVSNASDSGALAGASILSQGLLGLGIRSEQMAGAALTELVALIIGIVGVIFSFGFALPFLIGTAIAFYVKQLTTLMQAILETRVVWGNAKKTAVLYALQNAGVDQPRPTFDDFLRRLAADAELNQKLGSYSLDSLEKRYAWYLSGDLSDLPLDTTQKERLLSYSRSGFSRFMEDSDRDDRSRPNIGYWNYPNPSPSYSKFIPKRVVSRYAWGRNGDPGPNSYDNKNPYNYRAYDNYVEVEVTGASQYGGIEFYTGLDAISDCIKAIIQNKLRLPWWLEWIKGILKTIALLIVGLLIMFLPMGMEFNPAMASYYFTSEQRQTTLNYLLVTVTRYKRDNSLGLWRFRYGRISSQARSHAFPETNEITIQPGIADLCGSVTSGTNTAGGSTYTPSGLFDTRKHLFETELVK